MHRHTRTADHRLEPPGNREQGITNRLALEPAHVRTVQQNIFRISLLGAGIRGLARHLIRLGEHQFANEFLQ